MRFKGGGETGRRAEESAEESTGSVGAGCAGIDAGSEETFRRFRGPSSSWLPPSAWVAGRGGRSRVCCHGQLGCAQLSPAGQGISLKLRRTAFMASMSAVCLLVTQKLCVVAGGERSGDSGRDDEAETNETRRGRLGTGTAVSQNPKHGPGNKRVWLDSDGFWICSQADGVAPPPVETQRSIKQQTTEGA